MLYWGCLTGTSCCNIIIFSKDCVHWGLLPPATDEMKEKAHLAKGRFTGDPSFEFEHTEVKRVGEGEEQTEEEETVSQIVVSYQRSTK